MGPVTRALATPPPLIDRPPPIIPVRKTGRPWKMDGPAAITRTETLRVPRHDGRAIRKRRTEYNARSRIGAKMRCPKAFADRTAARDPDCRTAEIHIRIAPINRVNAPPAPPWPCACPDINRKRESLAPGTGHATTPHKGRHDHKAACRYRSPIRLFMTAGQVTEHAGAAALPGSLPKAGWLLADRGHGADCFREASKDRGDKDRGIMPTIPGGRRAASW